MANLLIDKESKKQLEGVLQVRNNFFDYLVNKSGLKKESLEDQIKQDFDIKSFLQSLNSDIFNYDSGQDGFSIIVYNQIFDDSVLKKIQSKEFQNNLQQFLSKSDTIYGKYTYLKKGELSLAKLKEIKKRLEENNFFVQKNKIVLKGSGQEINISDLDTLSSTLQLIETELHETKEFKALEKCFGDKKGRGLKDIIEQNPDVIGELKTENLDLFRKKLWLSYFKENQEVFEDLKNKYTSFEEKNSAKSFDDTPWKKAYEIFEERFKVPFEMEISNKESCILGESLPKVDFKFCDTNKEKCIYHQREKIEGDILSQGEKRALYLLNIIFDIEERKQLKQDTLFIIDDIADSFDYKNKYAIIEYLSEVSKIDNFYQIILTHNFDFFRSTQGRLLGMSGMKNCLIASKNNDQIFLESIEKMGIINPFKEWKVKAITQKNQDKNKYLIALIPFVRNIIEYTKGQETTEYLTLTHLLHKKTEQEYKNIGNIKKTKDFTFKDLQEIYEIIIPEIDIRQNENNILNSIFDIAKKLSEESVETMNLENKIVLSIAIRLKAEEFIISKINNKEFVSKITSDQTNPLINEYKKLFEDQQSNIKHLNQVSLMTPENIHLNSFMYEPILDLGDQHLKDLYTNVCNLK